VVLAAGRSSRMGQDKALLPVRGVPALSLLARKLLAVCETVVVVSGANHDALAELVALLPPGVLLVRNPHPDRGMFSSLQTGLAHTRGDVFVQPIDQPLVPPDVYAALPAAPWGGLDAKAPVYDGRRGHPVLLRAAFAQGLLAQSATANLRDLLRAASVGEVPVNAPEVLHNWNTPGEIRMPAE